MKSHVAFRRLAASLIVLGASACSSSNEGAGTITVTAYGESFIEDGIPASEMDDAWSVDFTRFEVTIDDVAVAGGELTDLDAVDLTEGTDGHGQELGVVPASVGTHGEGAFVIRRVEVEGIAEKDGESKTFNWTFDEAVDYHECANETDVADGENSTFQITVHADHLFYDSLVSSEPGLFFGPLADADENDDGEITRAELAATDIGTYDPGSEDGIDDLWTWLNALTATLGHVDGEGHCHAEVVD